MPLEGLRERIFQQLNDRGCQGRIVPVQHIQDLQREIEEHHRQGLLAEEFYQERLTWFSFAPPDSLPEAKSLIVVAVPRPQTLVVFTWNGKTLPVILPPTYVGYEETNRQIRELLGEILGPEGYQVLRAALPLKLLAVRSGLGQYGRNNICYVPGMGSFHQLVAVYSDLPCPEDNWREAQMMESCQNCRACLHHCPSVAIPSDRFLLRAERCIVFHNEKPGHVSFPSWIEPSWHNCLVGCLYCQKVCPENKDFLSWVEGREEFSQEETALVLEGVARAQLPAATAKKLERLDLIDSLDALPRNLQVLMNQRTKQG